ncbi:MAG: LysM peptidoglycan-binding domain-containing protein, partial [Zoogloea sp.]|nr:LysM peptidoglycan-binding domain-containing protein [Zoogloea sp.]
MQQYNKLLLSLLAVVVAGCSTTNPAPVSDGSGVTSSDNPADVSAQQPVVARPGYYIVKPGENLYRIALEHGQDYKEIAAWNGIENPNVVQAGQELRIVPPER